MVIHDYKTIFIHVPKTAGRSVTNAILTQILDKEISGPVWALDDDVREEFGIAGKFRHERACNYAPYIISEDLWDTYYKFAFVRNPWDRAVSEFVWRKNKQRCKDFTSFTSFLKFSKRILETPEKANCNDYYKDVWLHLLPQKQFISKNGSISVDDVFLFENLEKSMKRISEQMNIPLHLKHHHKSKRTPYRDYYNAKTRAVIRDLYKEDIEEFDYEF